MTRSLVALLLLASGATAQDLPPLACEGADPNWSMTIGGDAGSFDFGTRTEMSIPQRSEAAVDGWPKAITLLGGRQTAIAIVNPRSCSGKFVTDFPYEAFVLTQKGEEPVILKGCCTVAE